MGTRAAAFASKIKNLHDQQLRLTHNIVPIPSGTEIGNTIKYFSQTLLTVMKDVPSSPLEMIKFQDKDADRMALYPNLDYRGLYNTLSQLVDIVSYIQSGLHTFGQALLQCLSCLLPFLENDLIDSLPYLTASTISVLPDTLYQEIVHYLCFYILPFTITRVCDDEPENFASQSVSAIIMLVFQYSQDPAHHCQLLECLMTNKKNVVKDLLCVVAYGTPSARSSAAKLLFYYWPTFNPDLFDRRVVLQKFTNLVPFVCQRDMCPNQNNPEIAKVSCAEAAKVCYDHCISITFASDSPPPLYLCIECANEIHREHPNQMFFDILHPMQQVSMTCENKNCRASDKYAVSICFSPECASYNGNHPIRYCHQCHNIRHNNRRGGDHIVHMCLPKLWDMNAEMQLYMVDSIVGLLKESKSLNSDNNKDTASQIKSSVINVPVVDPIPAEERQLLGRYGVWLLVGLCTPDENTPIEIIGRLLSMLIHWFDVTTYSLEDPESTVERLKLDFVCGWVSDVCKTHFKVFVSCLLPHPPDYVRVGGHWDTIVSRTTHLKEGLNRLFGLVPYEVITQEIWDYVMPYWMESLVNDIPEKELCEFKILLSKIFDSDLTPLGFDCKKLFRFIAIRFRKPSPKVQEQALNWLQIISMLDITIPLHLLFSMFSDGVRMLKSGGKEPAVTEKSAKKDDVPRRSSISPVIEDESENTSPLSDDELPLSRHMEFETDTELSLTCCILMLDVLLKQMELQEIEQHHGVHTSLSQDVCRLLKTMLSVSWSDTHTCSTPDECAFCESCVIWHQMMHRLVQFLAPETPAHPPDPIIEEIPEESSHGRKSSPESDKKSDKADVVINMPMADVPSVGGVLVHMPHIMTATVETVTEQLDLAPMMTTECVIPAFANTVLLSDADVATATAHIARARIVGDADGTVEDLEEEDEEEDSENFWHTSVGKFKFVLEELPQQLQLIHQLLKNLPEIEKPDVMYYMLQSLHIICLYGDALTEAAKDHKGFLIWCQENLLIRNLWNLCNGENSHISEITVPLLLHCITLPAGSDMFWKVIHEEFHSSDWRVRFIAVERVTMIARFMDSTPLRSVLTLQAALANAFCYVISSMDDSDVLVAQRATLYLGTIHDYAVKSLIMCLETQFDSVIIDRPMVLQSLYQLHNCLSDRRILTWDFFLNRFDALFLEAQITLEKLGDFPGLRDLRNSDLNSENFVRKLHRAHEALSQHSDSSSSDISKTLSSSFGPKWPYKRAISAPASIIPRQDTKQGEEKKVPYRQTSLPPTTLKRKTSRFGIGQFLGTIPPSNSIPDGHIHPFSAILDDATLHKIKDLEESDKETIHLLVFLFMQFLSRSDQAYPSDEKLQAKIQSLVLRHLNTLLGYSSNEKGFYVTPQRLRTSPVFNAFISNLPQLLDQNHLMGKVILPICLVLLHYCPCPHRSTIAERQISSYSLWFLEPHTRRNWLMSLIVILYKYTQQPHNLQVESLIRIVMNTLDAQHHRCRRIPATVVLGAPPTRSRDVSQPSLGGDGERSVSGGGGDKFETPPLSPLYCRDGLSHVTMNPKHGKVQAIYHQKGGGSMETHWEEAAECSDQDNRKIAEISGSVEADETESELAAIPESPKSDSTLHGSPQGSLDETLTMGEVSSLKMAPHHTSFQSTPVEHPRTHWILSSEDDTVPVSNGNSERTSGYEGTKTSSSTSSTSHISLKSPLAIPPSSMTHLSTFRGVENQIDARNIEEWPDNHHHGSPIPRPMGRQKRMFEPIFTPGTTTASMTVTSSGVPNPPWQIDIHYMTNTVERPSKERLLPIGPNNKPASRNVPQPSNTEECCYGGSPESPLSKMEVMTVGSPIEYEDDNNMSEVMSTSGISQLELPKPERLLPIGHSREDISLLAERVRQALGTPQVNESLKERTRPPSTDSRKFSYPVIKNDSLEKPEIRCATVVTVTTAQATITTPTTKNEVNITRSSSPRRLIKQAALDSPPPQLQDTEEGHSTFYRGVHYDRKPSTAKSEDHSRNQRQKSRKTGLFIMGHHAPDFPRPYGSWGGPPQHQLDAASQQACHAEFGLKQSELRIGEECVYHRCSDCGGIKEEYSDEDIGLCIIVLETFVHREPELAAPLLPEILKLVSRIALNPTYPWQNESNMYLPGSAVSIAHQFLRCVLHQLAPNGIFVQIFQMQKDEASRIVFFRSVAQALLDFNELNTVAPLQLLLENLNSKKTLPLDLMPAFLHNIACYLECLPLEAGLGPGGSTWGPWLTNLEMLFRRIVLILPSLKNTESMFQIMVSVLKVPGISSCKSILEPFSKILSFGIQNSALKYQQIMDLCHLCNRSFNRDREKQFMTRIVIFELIQAIKMKTTLLDINLFVLINFLLQDVGGFLPLNIAVDESQLFPEGNTYNTSASECMRQHLADIMEILSDSHYLNKFKVKGSKDLSPYVQTYCKCFSLNRNQDVVGGILKGSAAQYLSLEFTRGTGRDNQNRIISGRLPWLFNAATTTLQQGQRDFADCLSHIRLLSWLLLGSLTHTAVHGVGDNITTIQGPCQPIPQDASCYIADHVQVVLAGFVEQSKTSPANVTSVYHSFILCQLWTIYLEQVASTNQPSSEAHASTMSVLLDFWGKVTPTVLQMITHSKSLADIVGPQFVNLLEALLECNSTILIKLFPMWDPIFTGNHVRLCGQLQARLQKCRNFPPPAAFPFMQPATYQQQIHNMTLLRWVQRLQFKMAQIELQSLQLV